MLISALPVIHLKWIPLREASANLAIPVVTKHWDATERLKQIAMRVKCTHTFSMAFALLVVQQDITLIMTREAAYFVTTHVMAVSVALALIAYNAEVTELAVIVPMLVLRTCSPLRQMTPMKYPLRRSWSVFHAIRSA